MVLVPPLEAPESPQEVLVTLAMGGNDGAGRFGDGRRLAGTEGSVRKGGRVSASMVECTGPRSVPRGGGGRGREESNKLL